MTQAHSLRSLVAPFSPIDLAEMDSVRLLNRLDTKFVFPAEKLPDLLVDLAARYRALEIAGTRLQMYQTLYLDTEDAAMYRMHHNGRANRIKIRKRWYAGCEPAFFEIKHRTNKKRTIKTRRRLPREADGSGEEFAAWLKAHCPFPAGALTPRTWTRFERVTLVDHGLSERVTIDCNLSWRKAASLDEAKPPTDELGWKIPRIDFCVAEIKQGGRKARPFAIDVLRQHGVHPSSFSKYCIGTALLHPELKQGCFRPLLRAIGEY